ncbi:MAG: HupE/UreJ family protein [Gammaproteobacteria bacterium]|nr:HupE/UreJ family protein [Gammaproteobacteria bacterium]
MRQSLSLLTFCLALCLAIPATAHEVRPGALEIAEVEPGRFSVTWKQPARADRRLPLDPELPNACAMRPDGPPEHTGSALIRRWHADCDLRSGTIAIAGLSATLTDVLVRIRYLDGTTLSRILRPADPAMDLADPAPALGGYFALGVEHLLLGPDHILFVIGLVLLIGSPWMLVKTITAFTLAHSVTLALSVLELVRLPQGPVEAVIALSILYLARELTLPEPDRSPLLRAAPWIMAFAFGLLHGFGFAGALADIGLPTRTARRVPAAVQPRHRGRTADRGRRPAGLRRPGEEGQGPPGRIRTGKSPVRLHDGLRGGVLDDRSGGGAGVAPHLPPVRIHS